MLKFLSWRKIFPTHLSSSPLRDAITGRASRGSGFCQKAFFNTVAGREADYVISSPATGHGLDDCSTVLVIPRTDNPMLVGHIDNYSDVKDPLFSALVERYKLGSPYVCVSLLKDLPGTDRGSGTGYKFVTLRPGTDPDVETGFVSENSMHGVKGKELFDRLHKVGTLSKIKHFRDGTIYLVGLRRVRITEMVSEDLLTVKVDHLKELPFSKDDTKIKATLSVLKLALQNYLPRNAERWKNVNECDCPQLCDYVARFSIPIMCKSRLQAFLEELDVRKRLQLTLKMIEILVDERDALDSGHF